MPTASVTNTQHTISLPVPPQGAQPRYLDTTNVYFLIITKQLKWDQKMHK